MNIRFTSSLTPEDENALAPALIRTITSILDLLPIAYMIRIDTSSSLVFQHSGATSRSNTQQPSSVRSRLVDELFNHSSSAPGQTNPH